MSRKFPPRRRLARQRNDFGHCQVGQYYPLFRAFAQGTSIYALLALLASRLSEAFSARLQSKSEAAFSPYTQFHKHGRIVLWV